MSFLTPLFLLGALAVAGPVIFHLIRRTTRERTRFGSLIFLQPTPPRVTKRSRLENLWLLLLRCLALGLLAFGFARPFLKQPAEATPSADAPRRTVILVDASASMRRAGLWDEARNRVAALLRANGPGDEAAVYTFGRQATPVVTLGEWNAAPVESRLVLASSRLAALSPGWESTDTAAAMVVAAEALAEGDGRTRVGPRTLVLVSDLQAGSRLDALQGYDWPDDVTVRLEPLGARQLGNAGLQLVAESADSTRAASTVVRVRVTNSADASREQFRVGWGRPEQIDFLGAGVDIYVPPGQSRVASVPLPAEGTVADRLVLRGDDEDFDNTVFVMPPRQQGVDVLYVGRDAAADARLPLYFLRRGLPNTPRLASTVTTRSPDAVWGSAEVGAAPFVVVADPVGAEQATVLRERLMNGGTILLVPKSTAMAPILAALAGVGSVAMEEARVANYAMLAEIDFAHPLFAPFADPRFSDFTKIHFWKYRKIDVAGLPGARVVARFDSGDPALLEVPVGRGRLLVLAAGWQPDDSQLAVSSKFVPLLYAMLEFSGAITSAPTQLTVGDRLPAPATLRDTPDAPPVNVPGQPGIYRTAATAGAAAGSTFAVNLDPTESRTAPLGREDLERLGVPLDKAAMAAQAPEAAAKERDIVQNAEAESRQKLWRWFVIATLVVLLVETVLAGWTARRLRPVEGSPS